MFGKNLLLTRSLSFSSNFGMCDSGGNKNPAATTSDFFSGVASEVLGSTITCSRGSRLTLFRDKIGDAIGATGSSRGAATVKLASPDAIIRREGSLETFLQPEEKDTCLCRTCFPLALFDDFRRIEVLDDLFKAANELRASSATSNFFFFKNDLITINSICACEIVAEKRKL